MNKILCEIYKSRSKADCYLYVCQQDGLKKVPEELLNQFKAPEKVMTLMLHPEKKLARAEVSKVMQQLQEEGYYLQLPPTPFASERRET